VDFAIRGAFERTETERSIPLLWDVADWLAANVPDKYDHTLVHGDYKPDNVMFGPETPPELTAVFDWELCTRGDPAMDLGWLLVYWPDEGDPEYGSSALPQFLTRDGYPTRRELVERYETATEREFEQQRFYRTFGVFKMASACEMMYRRYLEGNADDESYSKMKTECRISLNERTRSSMGTNRCDSAVGTTTTQRYPRAIIE